MTSADTSSPPMWPAGSDPRYIAARIRLGEAERRLSEEVERVAALRRALPPGPLLPDYELRDGEGTAVRLSSLFGTQPTLVVYHLMFHPDAEHACPMCSMWVDGFQGVAAHLRQRTAFAVVAKAPPAKLRAWARLRGWTDLRLLSSHGTTFNADMHAEGPDGAQRPMISVLVRDAGRVRHFYSQPANFLDGSERGIDQLSPVWNVLDLLPQGRGDWYAENDYVPGRPG
jgi:predicted dithiol-disulfide oxidoreductase (DUF899 family)